MSEGRALAAIAAGGGVGSLGRWAVGLAMSGSLWGTLAVNLTGACALGLLVAWLECGTRHPLARPLLAVGLLGGWTTYSSFALEVHHLAVDGIGGLIAHLGATLVLGVGAALLGLEVGDRRWGSDAAGDAVVVEGEL